MPDAGSFSIASSFSVHETMDRLATMIQSKRLMVFARVDHGGNAMQAGMTLRPTDHMGWRSGMA